MDVFDVSVKDILNESNAKTKEDHNEFSELKGIQIKEGTRKKRKPIDKLDATRLLSEKGLRALDSNFKNFKFEGQGREAEDLDRMMNTYQIWAGQMIPNLSFDDCIDKMEEVGHKREVQNSLQQYRYTGSFDAEMMDKSDDEVNVMSAPTYDVDEDWNYAEQLGDAFNSMVAKDASIDEYPVSLCAQIISNVTEKDASQEFEDGIAARIEANRQRALAKLREKEQQKSMAPLFEDKDNFDC